MVESIWSIIGGIGSIVALVISLATLGFYIFQYRKSLPVLNFRFFSSKYSVPIDKNGKQLFEKGIFEMEVLVINSGDKEVSIIDIFPPVEQTYQIKVFKEEKTYYMLNKLNKENKLSYEKDHIPLSNCNRLRIEVSFILNARDADAASKETDEIMYRLHTEDFKIITSNDKEYKINASKTYFNHHKKHLISICSPNPERFCIITTTEGRTRHPNQGVRFARPINNIPESKKDKIKESNP